MSGVLGRYLTRLFVARALAVLLGLAALLQLLDLLDKASDVLSRGGVADIGRYALLRLPTTLGRLMPLAVLVGAILAFRQFAASLEITAMRAAGIGTWRILGTLAPACALAFLLQSALLLGVAPRTERALADWWDSREPVERPLVLPQRLWLRNGTEIVAADAVSRDGGVLEGLLVIRRDAEGRALDRLDARRAAHGAEGWRLEGVRLVRPGASRPQEVAALPWPEGPAPRVLRELARPTEAQSPARLLAGWRGEGPVSRGPAFYAARLHALAASAAAPFVMLLLAAPAAFGLPRQEGAFRRAAVGLVLGLGYLVAAGLMATIGEAGGLHPVAAAWATPVLFAMAGLLLLWREEG
ncbi:LptF/LptG family permease [Roseomonas sp. GCM10028921]